MDEHLAQSVLPVRMGAILRGIFGTLAVGFASMGLCGITACLVKQRKREMGIRMALGASRRDALKLLLKQSMKLVTGICDRSCHKRLSCKPTLWDRVR